MSPESIMDPTQVDGRSDVYALGAVGYWLLTGTAPFAGRTIVEICAAHIHKEPDPPSLRVSHAIPTGLERLIMQCLAKQKHERPDGAGELLERLRALQVAAWNAEHAKLLWNARAQRAPVGRGEPIEYAHTLAIARRFARKAGSDR
jgi:serine/threonine-protein kinase